VHTGFAFGGALHTVPHPPQFEVSLAVSTHEPLQSVFVPQSVEQAPALQTLPAGHAVAQSPQCAAFESTSTHAPPHAW